MGNGNPVPVPSVVERLQAEVYILNYLNYKSLKLQTWLHFKERKPKYLDIETDEVDLIVDEVKYRFEVLKTQIQQYINELMPKYDYLFFYNLVHNSPAVLALVAAPPSVVWTGRIDPWTYIRYYFFTHKQHKPLIAKYYQGFLYNYYIVLPRVAKKNPDLPLVLLWKKFTEKHLKKGRKESRARKLALRDTMRIVIGNAYLIATIQAVESGLLDGVPPENILPKFLVEHPEKAKDMINPGWFASAYGKYTWEQLVRLVKG